MIVPKSIETAFTFDFKHLANRVTNWREMGEKPGNDRWAGGPGDVQMGHGQDIPWTGMAAGLAGPASGFAAGPTAAVAPAMARAGVRAGRPAADHGFPGRPADPRGDNLPHARAGLGSRYRGGAARRHAGAAGHRLGPMGGPAIPVVFAGATARRETEAGRCRAPML